MRVTVSLACRHDDAGSALGRLEAANEDSYTTTGTLA